MVTFLSQQWLDLLRRASGALPDETDDGCPPSAVIRHVVSHGPAGTVVYVIRLEDGRISEATFGDVDDADLSINTSYDDAVCLARGEVSIAAAYMQGRLKADGNMVMVLDVLACTHRPEVRALVAEVAGDTTFPEVTDVAVDR